MSSLIAIGIGLWLLASIGALMLSQRQNSRNPARGSLCLWLGFSFLDAAFQLMKWSDYHHYGTDASKPYVVIALFLIVSGVATLGVAADSLRLPSNEDDAADEDIMLKSATLDADDSWDDVTWNGFTPAPVVVHD